MIPIVLALALAQPAIPGDGPPQVPSIVEDMVDVPPPIVIRAGQYTRTLPWNATARQQTFARIAVQTLDRLDRERVVRPLARPFAKLRARLDDRLLDRVSILGDMEPYTRAKNTQILFNTTQWQPVSRATLDRKWNVPGGLVHATGWSSQSFRHLPSKPREHLGTIKVWNGGYHRWSPSGAIVYDKKGVAKKSMQPETGWKRIYDSGTIFADVLSTEAGPFEVRLAEKVDGRWDFYVAWSDASAAPRGYRRPTRKECLACHAQAGTGLYNKGLVPGGDHVFSDKFKALQ